MSPSDLSGSLRNARFKPARLDAVLRTEPLPATHEPPRPKDDALEVDSAVFGTATAWCSAACRCSSGPHATRRHRTRPVRERARLPHLLVRSSDVDGGAVRLGGVDVSSMDPDVLTA
ncbi:hypothetical protein FHR81_004576 [Actinoalloteichus hoggarensis]|uniref:Uncharacterized protein n=1 Tax=Actinoalloteichus hoggarensis TaxID=1470176 RepID=A0A221W3Q8_9PSEU|nr:hypothetical protein AHOG_14115 [Actinoalloteichus hoggarensis]MBB5923505.1 hypothetical protein [Actinoalloteichus hoggarensis]